MCAVIYLSVTVGLRQLDFVDVLIYDVFPKVPTDGWCSLSDALLAGLEGIPMLLLLLDMRVYS